MKKYKIINAGIIALIIIIIPFLAYAQGDFTGSFDEKIIFGFAILQIIIIFYSPPFLFAILLVIFLYKKVKHKQINTVIIIFLILSLIGTIFDLTRYLYDNYDTKNFCEGKIQELKNSTMQIYKITLPADYKIKPFDICDDNCFEARATVKKANGTNWEIVEYNKKNYDGIFENCNKQKLGESTCPFFAMTPGGISVYRVGFSGDSKFMVEKNNTIVKISSHYGFSNNEYPILYQAFDSLQPFSKDELINECVKYSKNARSFFGNDNQ